MRDRQIVALAKLFNPKNDPKYDYKSPLDLALALDPVVMRETPALRKIDEALVKVEAGKIKRLIITMPPQNGKSTLATRYNTLWLLRRNKDLRVAVVSYGDMIAQSFSRLIRGDVDTFNGEDGNIDLGIRLRKDSRAVTAWDIEVGRGGLFATGVGGPLTGRPVGYLIIDDPVKDAKDADSELLSEQNWEWWQSVARTRLAPGAPVVVIMTRWHQNDLAGRLLAQQRQDELAGIDNYDRWTVVNIPAQAESEDDILGRKRGEYMLSARGASDLDWERTKNSMSLRIWNAMYQGRPSPEYGDVFQTRWWQRYSDPIWQSQNGVYRVGGRFSLLQSWDLAFASKATSDYVVGQVWAHAGADAFLVDQVRKRLSFTETVAAMRAVTAKWPQATVKLVENKANGPAVIDALRHEIGGIVPVNPKESKLSRARAIAPFVESGNVYLPADETALFVVDDLIEEAVHFPNGANDDTIDAMSQALARIHLRGGRMEFWMRDIVPPCPHCGTPNAATMFGAGRCRECNELLPTLDKVEPEPQPEPSDDERAQQEFFKSQLPLHMRYDPVTRATMEMLDSMKPWYRRGSSPFRL